MSTAIASNPSTIASTRAAENAGTRGLFSAGIREIDIHTLATGRPMVGRLGQSS
jgi:hypothetical protein